MNNFPKRVFFIGIGGIGMSALARYFHQRGAKVSGYDKTPSSLTDALGQEGIAVHFEDSLDLLDREADLVVYTPAIPAGHKQFNYYKNGGYRLLKRSQVLGELTEGNFTIAVAGSHGKTTTSSMIAWILKASGYDCTAFLGGICINFESNFVFGKNKVMVVEADEFDRSFHALHPDIAVITAIDSDHLEVYGTREELVKNFLQFASQIHPDGTLIYKEQVTDLLQYPGPKTAYSLAHSNTALSVQQMQVNAAGSDVTLNNGFHFHLSYPGLHNIENAIGAAAVALELGIDPVRIADALSRFKGIHRRFEITHQTEKSVVIDDYAHHPEEIAMLLKSIRSIYPDKKITIIFQPHLFTRTRDLATEFAASLDLADQVALLPIYPARELPIEGVSYRLIAEAMQKPVSLLEKETLPAYVLDHEHQVIALVGAGDIDRLVPQVTALIKNKDAA